MTISNLGTRERMMEEISNLYSAPAASRIISDDRRPHFFSSASHAMIIK